jgi:hypothetical protein
MTTFSDCLLDADNNNNSRPKIHIKTDSIGQTNKTWTRFVFWFQKNMLLSFGILLAFILTLYLCDSTTGNSSSSEKLFQTLREKWEPLLFHPPHQDKLRASPSTEYMEPDTFFNWDARVPNASQKIKAAFVVNAREEDIYRLHVTILDIEHHFNERAQYPWIIIGHKVFSKHFREWITSITKSPVSFGLAPAIEWQEPYWIDIRKAEESIKDMVRKDLSRGESMHWRKMTR